MTRSLGTTLRSSDQDLNRQVLQQMRAAGDDLTTPRPIDFSHVLPSAASAASFAAEMKLRGFHLAVEETGSTPDLPWDVVVTMVMVPNLHSINEAERDLGEAAAKHGGRSDGWGCVRVP
jgi:hypothetical protein